MMIIGCFWLRAIAGVGVFQALFVMPAYFKSPPASLEAMQKDRPFLFWIPLQVVTLLALIVAAVSSEGEDRMAAIWVSASCYALNWVITGIFYIPASSPSTRSTPPGHPPRSAPTPGTVEVIGAALLARAAGVGYRRIGCRLGVPASTVRGWLRVMATRLESTRVFWWQVAARAGVDRPVPTALGSPWRDLLAALGAATAAVTESHASRVAVKDGGSTSTRRPPTHDLASGRLSRRGSGRRVAGVLRFG